MTIPVVSETAFAVADGVFSDPWLLDAALATAVIETPIFCLCGYRRAAEWIWFFVVLLEYALCGYAVREKGGKRLFRVLLLTNAVSFVAGVIYFLL